MRTRKEIMNSGYVDGNGMTAEFRQTPQEELILEVLLDIRDQLTMRGEQLGKIQDLISQEKKPTT